MAQTLRVRPERPDEPEGLPERYYGLYDVNMREEHRKLIDALRDGGDALKVAWERSSEWMRLTVIARDRRNLLAHVTAALDECGFTVAAADIFSVPGQVPLALDLFRVRVRDKKNESERVGRFEGELRARLANDENQGWTVPPLLPARHRRERLRSDATELYFDQDVSGDRTIVEVRTGDQPGVLRRITAAFASLDIEVELARLSSAAQRVCDVFYVARLSEPRRDALEKAVLLFLRRQGEKN